ncbi:Exodeoxyribonuclease VII small subunit [hydrothermal vent metagenome]|uniref:Exodeoxyribonuclease VII small subunit n=1 Tax=hydrothermal vent metagenome TaxID=652676 RepID=A0A3B1C6C8_9ZZZZ
MSDTKKDKKEIKFETALARLEEIVSKLEDGGLELDKSIELFEEGVSTAKGLQKKLDEAEKKIERLTKQSDGSLSAKPDDDQAEDDGAPF